MSWLLSGQLQSSLGSLKNQVTSSLKEVFEAVDDDDEADLELDNPEQDPKEKIELAKRRIRDLKDLLEEKSNDLKRLQQQNAAITEQRKFIEDQQKVQRDQFRELLKDKEAEIQILLQEKDQDSSREEINLLNHQIESLQNCLLELKDRHKREVEELAKSYPVQKLEESNDNSVKFNGLTSDLEELSLLRSEVAALKEELERERQQGKQNEEIQKTTDSASNAHSNQEEINRLVEELEAERKERQITLSRFEEEKKALEAEVSTLKEKLVDADLQRDLSRNDVDVEQLRAEVERVQGERDALKTALETEHSNYEQVILELKGELDTTKSNFENQVLILSSQLTESQSKNSAELDSMKFEYVEQIKSLEESRDHSKKCLESFQQELERVTTHHEVELNQLREKLQEVEMERNDLSARLDNLLKESDQSEDKLSNLQTSIMEEKERHRIEVETLQQSSQSEIESREQTLTLVRAELEASQARVEHLVQESNGLRQRIEHLTSDNEALMTQAGSQDDVRVDQLIRDHQRQLESIENEKRSLQVEIDKLVLVGVEHEECSKVSAGLKNEKLELVNEISNLKSERTVLKSTVEELTANLTHLTASLQAKSSSHDQLVEELSQLQASCQVLQGSLDAKVLEMQRIQSQLDEQTAASNEADEAELVQLRHELEALQVERDRQAVELSHLKDQLRSEEEKTERLNAELNKTKENLEDSVKNFEQELSSKLQQVSDLTIRVDQLQSEHHQVQMKNETLERQLLDFESVRSSFNDLQVKIKFLEEDKIVKTNELKRLSAIEKHLATSLAEKEELLTVKRGLENDCRQLRQSQDELLSEVERLKSQLASHDQEASSQSTLDELNARLHELSIKEETWRAESDQMMAKLAEVQQRHLEAAEQVEQLSRMNYSLKISFDEKCHDLEMAKRNLAELTTALEEKSSATMNDQQQKLQTIAAVKDLEKQLEQARRDREMSQSRMNDKDRELQELKREVNNVIDKKRKLEQELARLKEHLVAVEESSTQDALVNEERERELRKKLQVTEEALRTASAQQTTTSKEVTSHLHVLESRLTDLSRERDRLTQKLNSVTNELVKKARALENLEMALAGLQEEKRNDSRIAEQTYNEMLQTERQRQTWLENELKTLRERLVKTEEVLAAANSLGEQVAAKNQVISALKHEIQLKDEMLLKAKEEFGDKAVNNARFERNLVKNLIVSYFQADAKQKTEILGLIAKVLGFDEDERIKTGLDGPGYGLRYLRSMVRGSEGDSKQLDVSITEAFVKFLESESTPKTPIRLPAAEMAEEAVAASARRSRTSSVSKSITPNSLEGAAAGGSVDGMAISGLKSGSPNPLVMAANSSSLSNQMSSLPTFSVNRSSSAILRTVLQEEN